MRTSDRDDCSDAVVVPPMEGSLHEDNAATPNGTEYNDIEEDSDTLLSSPSSSSSLSSSESTTAHDDEGHNLMTNVVSLLAGENHDRENERKMSVKSTSSGVSHDTFHSTMNEDAYLLQTNVLHERINPFEGKSEIEKDESRDNSTTGTVSGTMKTNMTCETDHPLFLPDQQSMEGEHDSGVIYVSAPSGKTRNGYHRYDSFHSQTTGTTKEGFTGGESSMSNTKHTLEGASPCIGQVMSEMSGSVMLTDNRFNMSLNSNELRQRVGVNNTDNRTRFSSNHGLSSNRVRSFTSPDTRSPQRYNANNRLQSLFVSSTETDNQISPQRSLLSSLDSGMTALRRWMVNRASQSVGTPASNPRPSRAAQVIQMQVNDDEESNHGSEPSIGGGGGGAYEHYVGSISSGDRQIPSLSSSLSYHGSMHSGTSEEYLHSIGLVPQHDGAIMYPQTIQEEDEHPSRQRANSEPERSRWTSIMNRRRGARDRIQYPPLHGNRRLVHNRQRQQRESLVSDGNSLPSEMIFDMESSEHLNRVSFRIGSQSSSVVENNPGMEMPSQRSGNASSSATSGNQIEDNVDPLREARRNWIRINRVFQLIVTVVGLIFSFLLFSIMVTWVVLTSAYVVSIDEVCDLPLKTYFWLATIQLMLDVFRKEIMRFVFRFDPSRHRDQIPTRVIFYNLAYLTYAMLVLRLGISSIFLNEGSQCPYTAKKLFNTTRIFVSITIAAWLLVLFGYLIPFCIVAILLTRNGYSPALEQNQGSNRQNFGVFPLSNVHNGAPPSCIDRMKSLSVEEFREDFPRECCVSHLGI
jgi:hypothetical protein